MKRLTGKEEVIMNHFWDNKGELFVRELRELYPDPKPHFNTLSTQVRTLEAEGFLGHRAYGPTYQYYTLVSRDDYNWTALAGTMDRLFGNSYLSAVSSLVREEKITVDELKELIRQIEEGNGDK